MKALIQRVMNAKVTVNGEVVSSIGQGACIFIGICNNDSVKDMEYMARKILSIKLFDDENDKKWKKSVVDSDFEILCVSQFTLYNTWKGNKPDFHNAMPSEKSKEFYDNFIQLLKDSYKPEKIKVNDEVPVSIGPGICVLVGFHKEDTLKDLEFIVKKILSVKLYADDNDENWEKSVVDKQLEVLIISQYTIYNGWKGNTPDFHKTMGGEKSQELYNKLMEMAREIYNPEKVKDGVFGIYRQLYLENDGSMTFEIDSPQTCHELPNENGKSNVI